MYATTRLERGRLGRAYRGRLQSCLAELFSWVASLGTTVVEHLGNLDDLNALLVQYVQYCADTGVPLWRAKHAILACQTRWRHLRGRIFRPWDAIKTWELERGKTSRRPFPVDVIVGLFVHALATAMEQPSQADVLVPLAVLSLVAFYGLLRPGEVVALTAGDVRFQDTAEGLVAILALRDPKNRRAMGAAQFSIVRIDGVARWLRWLVDGLPLHVRIWPRSYAAFGTAIKSVLAEMGLASCGLTAGSLRPGGTTYYHIMGKHISDLKYLGRWRSETSLAIYIQEAMAYLVWIDISHAGQLLLKRLSEASVHILRAPPIAPWPTLFSRRTQWLAMKHGSRLKLWRAAHQGSSRWPRSGRSTASR